MLDKKQAKILAIDDEPVNLAVLNELLEAEGYLNVVCEQDPRKGIQIYKQQKFDLVLLDLSMPGTTGFEVMAIFQSLEETLPPPVLVLTALSDKATKIRALTSGASDFVTKPFDHEEVISRVNNLVTLQLSQRALQQHSETLEFEVQQRTKQLEQAELDAINRLGLVADYRDTETSAHTKRVGHISEILGLAIGLDQAYCELLFHAAPMHDIGKVGIPDNILLKPGKLNPDEWQIMQQHVTIGAEILKDSPSDIVNVAYEIALTHHERWDGTGYPAGLKGDAIPISGRIVIIADVFDALSSDRPYKKAWPLHDIYTFMQEQKGKMFDPTLIEQFLAHKNDIEKVKRTLLD